MAYLGAEVLQHGPSGIHQTPYGSFAGKTAQPIVVATTGGRSKGRKRRYTVEVDNQYFIFDTISEVEAFLATVREEVQEVADQLVTTSVVPKPPRITVKTGTGKTTTSQTLQRAVQRTRKTISRAYVEAAKRREIDEEISRLMIAKIEREDEEDTILMLLM